MKTVTRILPPSNLDLRAQPPDPWGQMFEEQRDMMLREPERGVAGLRPLAWTMIVTAAVLISVGVVLWP